MQAVPFFIRCYASLFGAELMMTVIILKGA